MNKKKIITILIGAVFLSVSFTSLVGAVELQGEIDVGVDGWAIGMVTPIISIENQSITLDAYLENETYYVNENLTLNLDINDNTGREKFFFPRAVVCSVVMVRKLGSLQDLFPIMGILGRIFPVKALFNTIPVVDSSFGNKSYVLDIPMNYALPSNVTYDNGEELTLNILVMGMLPGDINGFSDSMPFVQHKKITLTIDYI